MINKLFIQKLYFLLIFLFLVIPSYITIFHVPIGKAVLLFLLLLSLLYFFRDGDYKIRFDSNTFLFCTFVFLLIVSSILSSSYEGVARRGLINGIGLLSIYYLTRKLSKSSNFLHHLVYFFGAVLFVNYLVVLIELYLGFQLSNFLPLFFGVDLNEWSFIAEEKIRSGTLRYQGLFSHPLILSVMASLVLFTLINGEFYNYTTRFLLSFIAIHCILLSDSRAGLLTVIIFPLVFGFGKNNKYLYYTLVLILGLVCALFFSEQTVDFLNSLSGDDIQTQNSTDNRVLQLEEALGLFYMSNTALLLGFGSESASELMEYGTIDNLFLSIFLEIGLIGFLVCFYMSIKALYKAYYTSNTVVLALFLVTLLYALILSLFQFFFIFILILALVVRNENSTNS